MNQNVALEVDKDHAPDALIGSLWVLYLHEDCGIGQPED